MWLCEINCGNKHVCTFQLLGSAVFATGSFLSPRWLVPASALSPRARLLNEAVCSRAPVCHGALWVRAG